MGCMLKESCCVRACRGNRRKALRHLRLRQCGLLSVSDCEGETPSRQLAGRRRYTLTLRADSFFLTTEDSMPFACIFVPDFPVEALLRAEPDLRSHPLAVLEGKSPVQTTYALNE